MIMEHMTTAEVDAAVASCRSVIVPFGVMEAHGPHLPLATDTIQAYDAAKRAAELVSVFVAAPVPYGMCRSASGHAGTIGISGDTLRSLILDIIESLYRMGMINIILYSGHASSMQLAAMQEAGEQAIAELDELNLAVVSDYDMTRKADFIITPGDVHAGEIETSRMMYVCPELVRGDRIPAAERRRFPSPILVRDTRRYWPGSVEGDPGQATAQKGERLAHQVAEDLAQLVKRMNQFDPH